MKNFLILLAVVLVAAGAYWKFRDQIHGKVEEVQKDATKGGGTPSVIPAIKDAISSAPTHPTVEEKLALASSEFIRGLPDSMASLSPEGGVNRDLVLEVVTGDGTAALPLQLRLTPNVWLDSSTIQLPGGVKVGTAILVHLQSVSPAGQNVAASEHIVQCSAEALPQPLAAGIRRESWRATMTVPAAAPPSVITHLWITDFLRKVENNELQGTYMVEGTFGAYQRAAKNAPYDTITLEEAKNIKFHFTKQSMGSAQAEAVEKIKKQGNRITLRIKVGVESTPKYVAQTFAWCIPVKDQFDYWSQQFAGKGKLGHTLALAAWAESRDLADQARTLYEKARGEVTRESVTTIGAPAQAIRLHLADEVHDQWFYQRVAAVEDANHHPVWRQAPAVNAHDFAASPRPPCVIFRTKATGSPVGDYYLLQE